MNIKDIVKVNIDLSSISSMDINNTKYIMKAVYIVAVDDAFEYQLLDNIDIIKCLQSMLLCIDTITTESVFSVESIWLDFLEAHRNFWTCLDKLISVEAQANNELPLQLSVEPLENETNDVITMSLPIKKDQLVYEL